MLLEVRAPYLLRVLRVVNQYASTLVLAMPLMKLVVDTLGRVIVIFNSSLRLMDI